MTPGPRVAVLEGANQTREQIMTDREEPADESKLLGLQIGLITGINILIESLVSEGRVEVAALTSLFTQKIDELRAQYDPMLSDAANVLDQMRRPLVSEERAQVRKLLSEPPQGAA